MAEEMKVRLRRIEDKEGDQSVKERWMREGAMNERRKKRRRTARVLSDSHSLGDMTGLAIQSVSPCHPLPGTIFLAALHTHPPAERTHTPTLTH